MTAKEAAAESQEDCEDLELAAAVEGVGLGGDVVPLAEERVAEAGRQQGSGHPGGSQRPRARSTGYGFVGKCPARRSLRSCTNQFCNNIYCKYCVGKGFITTATFYQLVLTSTVMSLPLSQHHAGFRQV